jgi:hypothetical protein
MDEGRREVSTADLARSGQTRDTAHDTPSAVAEPRSTMAKPASGPENRSMLFPQDEADRFRGSWSEIQGMFVDSPRQAVERADSLVADAMKRLAATFAQERESLEGQWDRGDEVTTEDLRVALQRYRAFFDRLLSV